MNKYELRVNNAIIMCEGNNEYSAMFRLHIFGDICEMVECLITEDCCNWVCRVELNDHITLAFIKEKKEGKKHESNSVC